MKVALLGMIAVAVSISTVDAGCPTTNGFPCVIPFWYKNADGKWEWHTRCTYSDWTNTPWCATKVDGERVLVPGHWGVCQPYSVQCYQGCILDGEKCYNGDTVCCSKSCDFNILSDDHRC